MRRLIKIVSLASLLFLIPACGAMKGKSQAGIVGETVLATINGTKITEDEVMKYVEPELKKIDSELYKIKKAGIDELVEEKLLEQEASKAGKNKESYVEEYLKANSKDPTEEEVKKYYEFRKNQMGDKKFEEVKGQIAEFLKVNQENTLQRKLLNDLRAKADIQIHLEPPRIDLSIEGSPKKGPKDAPVLLVEFSDYQCPFCGRSRPTVNKILETYPKDVQYVLKDFPLSFHKDSQKAHEAAHCAGEQGKYWEMSKNLFENQRALDVESLKKYAKNLSLDTKKFNECLDSGKHVKTVAKGLEEGRQAGVNGTPAFFVNGIMISGARPFEDFKEIIDSELKKK